MADPAAGTARTPAPPPPLPALPVRTFDTIDADRDRRMHLFVEAYGRSGNWALSCRAIGVHRDTPRGWVENYPAFALAVTEAEEDRLDRCVGNVLRMADDLEHKDSFRANLVVLNKGRPEEWGRAIRGDVGAMGAPIPSAVAEIPADELALLSLLRPEHPVERVAEIRVIEEPDGHGNAVGGGADGAPPTSQPADARP